jgi:TrmH family RNA methyltransferase
VSHRAVGPRHPVLQRLRRLARQRRARDEEAAFVIDGPTLLAEALAAGVTVAEVVAEPDAPLELVARAARAGARVLQVPAGSLARVAATVTPQPVAAIAAIPAPGPDPAAGRGPGGSAGAPLSLVLVGVGDPGNAGTLLRSADAVGASDVAFCDGSVDPYNPKCVRASAGSLFRVPVVRSAGAGEVLDRLGAGGVRRIGAVARGGRPYDESDLAGPVAVVLGSEAHGLAPAVLARLDEQVTIPMRGPMESLNVAMAGTVVCFEAFRQRRRRSSDNPLDGTPSTGAGCSAA